MANGWYDWVAGLGLDHRLTAPDETRILAVHAAPGTGDGEGIHPGRVNGELVDLLGECKADLLIVGHTHEPMVRRVGRVLVVNLGLVSNPRSEDLRASYVLLDVESSGVRGPSIEGSGGGFLSEPPARRPPEPPASCR